MERIADNGKKLPLLVAGELPAALPGASLLDLSAPPPGLNDYYVVVAVPEGSLAPTLAALERAGACSDQVLVFVPAAQPLRHHKLASFGLLERIEGESGEELRARVTAKIETQRQKKLVTALCEAQERELPRRLGEAELARTLDALRLAHALSCGYGLGPAAHVRALRACLDRAPAPAAWQGEPSPELLIPEAAALMVDAFARGLSCRDHVRERASGLSFRARAELLHQVENCLAPLAGRRRAI